MEVTNYFYVLGFVLFFAWYLSNVAGRLDRLHLKAEAARLSLDTQLAHRTSAVGRLVEKLQGQNQQNIELANVWQEVLKREADEENDELQWQYESALTLAINTFVVTHDSVVNDPDYANIMADLAKASRRVQYAKAFHNDAQTNALKVRQRWLVKFFRLAGRAKLPSLIEFDDSIAPLLKNK